MADNNFSMKVTIYGILTIILCILLMLIFSCERVDIDTDTVTDVDGNVYNTITIGEQIWLKENLNTTKLNDGTRITHISYIPEWQRTTLPAYCYYDNDANTYANTLGALYNWYSINTNKLCPVGWHVPSYMDWVQLFTYLGGEAIAGGKLKSLNLWYPPNNGATNEVDFSALPGGFRDIDGRYNNIYSIGFWWSSTEEIIHGSQDGSYSYEAYNILLHTASSSIFGLLYIDYPYNKQAGMSVRCLKD